MLLQLVLGHLFTHPLRQVLVTEPPPPPPRTAAALSSRGSKSAALFRPRKFAGRNRNPFQQVAVILTFDLCSRLPSVLLSFPLLHTIFVSRSDQSISRQLNQPELGSGALPIGTSDGSQSIATFQHQPSASPAGPSSFRWLPPPRLPGRHSCQRRRLLPGQLLLWPGNLIRAPRLRPSARLRCSYAACGGGGSDQHTHACFTCAVRRICEILTLGNKCGASGSVHVVSEP